MNELLALKKPIVFSGRQSVFTYNDKESLFVNLSIRAHGSLQQYS